MRQSWSPRWRGHMCRPVAEQIPTLRLDRTLRALLTNAPHVATRTISRTWSRGDQPIATCQISVVHPADSVLAIQLRSQVGSTTITETVMITWVDQKLGGQRAWWVCPRCQCRCGVLFNPTSDGWCCRICAKITYRSCNASDRRVTAALSSGDLASALESLGREVAIGSLILRQKAGTVISRRTQRDYRRWFRRTYPRRHLPRSLQRNHGTNERGGE